MFDIDNSTSYLADSAGEINEQPAVKEKTIQFDQQVATDFDNEIRQNPDHHPSAVSTNPEHGFEPYWKRTTVAPYSDHYHKPTTIPSTFDVNTSYGHIEQKEGLSAFQSGVLMSGLIIIGSVLGYSLESKIENKYKIAGYGALIGAVGANAIRYGLSQGVTYTLKDGLKGLLGASIPLAPVMLAMLTKKPLKKPMLYVIGGTNLLLTGYVVFDSMKRKFNL